MDFGFRRMRTGDLAVACVGCGKVRKLRYINAIRFGRALVRMGWAFGDGFLWACPQCIDHESQKDVCNWNHQGDALREGEDLDGRGQGAQAHACGASWRSNHLLESLTDTLVTDGSGNQP